MITRRPLLAGNWKMFKMIPEALELVNGLKRNCAGISDRDILVCPPFTAIVPVAAALKGSNISVGGQNLYWESKGAFTGEIAPGMLLDAGCAYVIVGHSERRQYFGETDESVKKKTGAAFAAGLAPIACVGETLAEREQNSTFNVVERQIRNGVAGLSPEQATKLVIAYEPVWAIGTGKTATSAQAEEVHAFIRKIYAGMYGKEAAASMRILYGGSVKPDNIAELMKQPNIDGGLVGGASLDVESFTRIIQFN